MAMNPADIMKIMGMKNRFEKNHPKFLPFIRAVMRRGINEGTILEIKVVSPNGDTLESNLKVTAEDLQLLQELRTMNPNM